MIPKSVGVITSPTGAAVRDIINVIGRIPKGIQAPKKAKENFLSN